MKRSWVLFRNGQEIKVRLALESSGNFLSMKYKNIIIWSRNAWEKWSLRYLPLQKSKNEHQNMSTSTNIHLFLPTCIDSKKSSKNLTGIFYQMDHIWWAPSGLKKTFALIFLEKLAILLRQDFLKTLYTYYVNTRQNLTTWPCSLLSTTLEVIGVT